MSLSVKTAKFEETLEEKQEQSQQPGSPNKLLRKKPALTISKAVVGQQAEETEAESQADALLRAKRERAKKRQTMPGQLPAELQQFEPNSHAKMAINE
jgi:hypothetical protein